MFPDLSRTGKPIQLRHLYIHKNEVILPAGNKFQRLTAVHYHLGMAYLQSGYLDKAKKQLQAALASKTEFDGSADAKKALAQLGG